MESGFLSRWAPFDIKRVPVFRLTPKKGGFEILKKKINLVRWAEGNRGDLTQNPDSGGPRGTVRRHLRIPPPAENRNRRSQDGSLSVLFLRVRTAGS